VAGGWYPSMSGSRTRQHPAEIMIQLHLWRALELSLSKSSVPAQGVLCHDRSRDLLGSYTAVVAAVASLAAATAGHAGSESTVASAGHPGITTQTAYGAISVAAAVGNRVGPFVGQTLLPVPARDEEHGSTICQSSDNSTGCNTSSSSVDGVACSHVAAHCTSLSRAVSRAGLGVGGVVRIARFAGAVFREAGGVNQRGEDVDRFVLVVVERGAWQADLLPQSVVEWAGNHEHSQSLSIAQRVPCVGCLQPIVDDFGVLQLQGVGDGHLQVQEDLVATVVLSHPLVVETLFEANLTDKATCWHRCRHALGRLDPLSQFRRNHGNGGRGSR
jgi:cytochrome c551/c552